MIRLLLALAVTVALGLLSRLRPIGWPPYDKSLGDVLYAVAFYLAFALAFPRQAVGVIAAAALGWCLAVELFKLTGLPLRLQHHLAARWLLGTTFSLHNLLCYLAGVAAIALLDGALLRPGRWRR
jgi:hypothetical protein